MLGSDEVLSSILSESSFGCRLLYHSHFWIDIDQDILIRVRTSKSAFCVRNAGSASTPASIPRLRRDAMLARNYFSPKTTYQEQQTRHIAKRTSRLRHRTKTVWFSAVRNSNSRSPFVDKSTVSPSRRPSHTASSLSGDLTPASPTSALFHRRFSRSIFLSSESRPNCLTTSQLGKRASAHSPKFM